MSQIHQLPSYLSDAINLQMDEKPPAEADRETSLASTQIEVLPDGRIIIRAEIASNAQLSALKSLVDGLASQDMFSEDFDDS